MSLSQNDPGAKSRAKFWLGFFLVLGFVFWYFQSLLLPFVASLVLAYFLDPVADRLERWGLPRILATAIIILTAVVAMIAVVVAIIPALVHQLSNLVTNLPQLVKSGQTLLDHYEPQWLRDQIDVSGFDAQAALNELSSKIGPWLASISTTLWSGSKALLDLGSLLILTPVLAFYLLNDWDRMVATVDGWLPRAQAPYLRALARDIDQSLSGFIFGQGRVCLIMAVFYSVAYAVVGLKSALAIGIMTGILSFIPYFGAALGGITAVLVGLLQTWSGGLGIVGVIAVWACGQFFEGNILSPRLVGRSVGLHPVWLMFALVVFSYLYGFAGLLLAVPLGATVGVILRHALALYLRSELYLGPAPPSEAKARPPKP